MPTAEKILNAALDLPPTDWSESSSEDNRWTICEKDATSTLTKKQGPEGGTFFLLLTIKGGVLPRRRVRKQFTDALGKKPHREATQTRKDEKLYVWKYERANPDAA